MACTGEGAGAAAGGGGRPNRRGARAEADRQGYLGYRPCGQAQGFDAGVALPHQPWSGSGQRRQPAVESGDGDADGDKRVTHPALVAAIETHDGNFEGIQRIFLTPEGAKAAIAGAKKHLGPLQKGGVWFGNRNATRIAMTEGVEDALAAIEALPPGTLENLAIVASVGVGRMHRVELPASARELVVLQDTGAAGERGWQNVQDKYRESAVRVTRIVPRGGDITTICWRTGMRWSICSAHWRRQGRSSGWRRPNGSMPSSRPTILRGA